MDRADKETSPTVPAETVTTFTATVKATLYKEISIQTENPDSLPSVLRTIACPPSPKAQISSESQCKDSKEISTNLLQTSTAAVQTVSEREQSSTNSRVSTPISGRKTIFSDQRISTPTSPTPYFSEVGDNGLD